MLIFGSLSIAPVIRGGFLLVLLFQFVIIDTVFDKVGIFALLIFMTKLAFLLDLDAARLILLFRCSRPREFKRFRFLDE